jgi:hypothetical protein
MVRNSLIIALVLIGILSCKTWYHTNEGGFWPKSPRFHLKPSQIKLEDSKIETKAIYKLYRTYLGEDNFYSKKKMYDELVSNDKYYKERSTPVLRFYDNFRFSIFLIKQNSKISTNDFNPKGGYIGVYSLQNKNIIDMESFWYVEGSGKYVKSRGMIKQDTLHIIEKVYNQINHKIYIKEDVPTEFLYWKVDW